MSTRHSPEHVWFGALVAVNVAGAGVCTGLLVATGEATWLGLLLLWVLNLTWSCLLVGSLRESSAALLELSRIVGTASTGAPDSGHRSETPHGQERRP